MFFIPDMLAYLQTAWPWADIPLNLKPTRERAVLAGVQNTSTFQPITRWKLRGHRVQTLWTHCSDVIAFLHHPFILHIGGFYLLSRRVDPPIVTPEPLLLEIVVQRPLADVDTFVGVSDEPAHDSGTTFVSTLWSSG